MQEKVAVVGSSLLSILDKLAFERIPVTEDVSIVNNNIGKFWARWWLFKSSNISFSIADKKFINWKIWRPYYSHQFREYLRGHVFRHVHPGSFRVGGHVRRWQWGRGQSSFLHLPEHQWPVSKWETRSEQVSQEKGNSLAVVCTLYTPNVTSLWGAVATFQQSMSEGPQKWGVKQTRTHDEPHP